MMRELGRSIMDEVDQKANSKAKLMAMELAKKMANEVSFRLNLLSRVVKNLLQELF